MEGNPQNRLLEVNSSFSSTVLLNKLVLGMGGGRDVVGNPIIFQKKSARKYSKEGD